VPSALWYLENQFRLSNARDHEVREAKVLTFGEDLVLIKRVYGTFSVGMALKNFPMDEQDLSVCIEVLCRRNGPFPVTLVRGDEARGHQILVENFKDASIWQLSQAVSLELTSSTTGRGVTYPGFRVSAHVTRHPEFYLVSCFPNVQPVAQGKRIVGAQLRDAIRDVC
jgi:hypothetical protein